MTDAELAAAYAAMKQLEAAVRVNLDETRVSETTEHAEATAVLRQAVALRRVLGNWIVSRATSAHLAARTR